MRNFGDASTYQTLNFSTYIEKGLKIKRASKQIQEKF